MKNPFKRSKDKFPKNAVPRSSKELQDICNQLLVAVGKAQYHKSLLEEELKNLTSQLMAINNEGAERQRLDAAAAEEKAKSEVKEVK